MARLLDPTLDIVFKLLFAHERNRNLLTSLLTAVLSPHEPIFEVEVLNPDVDKNSIRDKGIVLDVRVRLRDGSLLNVEMQSRPERAFRQRGLFYWSRLYQSQLERGRQYQALAPVVSLFILDFVELPGDAYHREFRVLDTDDHEHFSDDLAMHTLELPKVPDPHDEGLEGEPLLAKWGRFLKAKDLEQLAMSDPIFEEAKNALEHLSADPDAQALAEERKIWTWNYETEMRLAKKEGLTEGEAKGRLEGERLLLVRLLSQKFGPLTDALRGRLEHANESELTLWAERILTATTIEGVFG